MKQRSWWIIPVMGAVAALLAIGCDKEVSSANDPAAQMSDEEALEELFLADLELEAADAWGDEEGDIQGGGSLDEPIDPVRWGRLGRRLNARVDVDIEGDSVATITRTVHFDGIFKILADTTENSFTVIDKEMHNALVRKARAIRVAETPFPRRNWRIVEITPEVLASHAPNPNTIWPVEVEVWRNGGDGAELIAEITDPLNTWLNRESLPVLHPQDEVVVYVTANRDGAFGVLHPRVHRLSHGGRLPLLDDGEYPDEVAGDGVYSGSYVAGERVGPCVVGVDLIDEMTLFDSEAPYDAGGWGVPYRVALPDQQ